MRKVTLSSYTQQFIIEKVSKRCAELCVSGLFNTCGGIEAAYSIASHSDTNFAYNVYLKKAYKQSKIDTAKSFCSGVAYSVKYS